MKKNHNFRELFIWKDSMSLVKKIYLLTNKLPKDDRFGLVSQINRSYIYIPSNIAEGSGRTTEKEFSRFLVIAMSSSYELETQLILASDLFEIDATNEINDLKNIQNKIGAFKKTLITE